MKTSIFLIVLLVIVASLYSCEGRLSENTSENEILDGGDKMKNDDDDDDKMKNDDDDEGRGSSLDKDDDGDNEGPTVTKVSINNVRVQAAVTLVLQQLTTVAIAQDIDVELVLVHKALQLVFLNEAGQTITNYRLVLQLNVNATIGFAVVDVSVDSTGNLTLLNNPSAVLSKVTKNSSIYKGNRRRNSRGSSQGFLVAKNDDVVVLAAANYCIETIEAKQGQYDSLTLISVETASRKLVINGYIYKLSLELLAGIADVVYVDVKVFVDVTEKNFRLISTSGDIVL